MVTALSRSTSNLRNERVEQLVDFALKLWVRDPGKVHRRFSIGPDGFKTEFDHKVDINNLILLGQTTCYKEKGTDGGEPNKTYEMRETLMEYLLAYLNLLEQYSGITPDLIRLFHVIIGDPDYSYSYFHIIRSKTYDLNIVVNLASGSEDLYDSLEKALPEETLRDSKSISQSLERALKESASIATAIKTIAEELSSFEKHEFPSSLVGKTQRDALIRLVTSRKALFHMHKRSYKGAAIKREYLAAAKGNASECSPEIRAVVQKIFLLRPFLPEAKVALSGGSAGWKNYVDSHLMIPDFNIPLKQTLIGLWNIDPNGVREVVRRVIVKLPGEVSQEGTLYPQDIPVRGVNEHNLYGNTFPYSITEEIIDFLLKGYHEVNVASTEKFYSEFVARGRGIVKTGFDYDIQNGTVIKPSLYYLQNELKKHGYQIQKPMEVLRERITGYIGKLFEVNGGAFNSFSVICSKKGIALALFKSKYFRPQEFDRRVKEEGFVSFTSMFQVRENDGKTILEPHLPNLPRVLFIDTDDDWEPNKNAVEQLFLLGWDVFFNIKEMMEFLVSLEESLNQQS